MGEGPGFRKVRKALGVTAFGVNAVVVPPGYARGATCTSARRSSTSCTAGRSSSLRRGHASTLGPGGFAARRPGHGPLDAQPIRTEEAVLRRVGGAGGYVGRDGMLPEGETSPR